MFTREIIKSTTKYIDKHGDRIGELSLTIYSKEDNDGYYATIEADFPKYSELTTWGDIAEARASYDSDIRYYTDLYREV